MHITEHNVHGKKVFLTAFLNVQQGKDDSRGWEQKLQKLSHFI